RIAAVIDRVNTTYQTWLATTFECVQCHSHTYDPIKFEEYYKSLAFFNNTRDEDTPADYPTLRFFSDDDSLRVERIKQWIGTYADADGVASMDRFLYALEPKIDAHACDRLVNGALVDTKWLGIRNGGSARLPAVTVGPNDVFFMNYRTGTPGGQLEMRLGSLDGPVLARVSLEVTQGMHTMAIPTTVPEGKHDIYLIFRNASLPPDQ